MKNKTTNSNLYLFLAVLVTIVVFVIDIWTRRGIAEEFLYIIVVTLTIRIPGKRSTIIAASTGIILSILGFNFSYTGAALRISIIHRLFSVLGIFITMFLILKNKEKERLIHEKNEQLKKLVMELKISNYDLEQYAYVASHDLREPLTNITNYIGLLEKRLDNNINEENAYYLKVIVKSAEKMKILIRDLLLYSLIKKNIVIEEVDLNKVLKDVLIALDFEIKGNQAKIQGDNLPLIYSNTKQIRQLFQNLILNALKFKKKNITPEIRIHCEDKNIEWEFSVSDNGIGIEEKYFHKIFFLFQRLHSQDEYAGSGIGLAICKKIIEINGGKIWVSSTLNIGSTFYFTIPKQPSKQL